LVHKDSESPLIQRFVRLVFRDDTSPSSPDLATPFVIHRKNSSLILLIC